MCRMRASSSGCSIGSPPLKATTDVPSCFSFSMRDFRTCVGTGSETLSYSLQYPQSMLHRRMGTICTRSGCAVCTSPRANSRTDRPLRLTETNDKSESIATRRCRLDWPEPAHPRAYLQRPLEDGADGNEPEQAMTRDRREACRRHAAALRAIGGAAVLARRDLRRQVGGEGRGRSSEDAFFRRHGRLHVRLDQAFWHRQLWKPHAQRHQVGNHPLPIGGSQPLLGHFANLWRVEAVPDLFDLRYCRPEGEELLDVAVAVHLLPRHGAVDGDVMPLDVLEDPLVGRRSASGVVLGLQPVD